MSTFRRRRILLLAAAILWLAAPGAEAREPAPRVSLVVLMEDPYGRQNAEKWHQLLDRLENVSVRIRSARRGERVQIEELDGGDFRVTGVLTGRNQLELPGGSFSLLEAAKIREWVAKLQGGGTENLLAPRIAFDLTAKQLTAVHERLEHVVKGSTAGRTVAQAARMIAAEAKLSLQSDPNARRGAAEVVENEARGLAAGAALALVLRPGGLVLTLEPTRSGDVALRIRRGDAVKEFWPVGWPLQGSPSRLAPDMFKRLNVEINQTPLTEALEAVALRLDTPLLLDVNSLAREGVDPAQVRVDHPSGNSYYKRIIDRMLAQAKLTGRWRQDEAGKVFYWITTTKQALRDQTRTRQSAAGR